MRMRDEKEVGTFWCMTDKANEAYRVYASVYLDHCDDNTDHFFNRQMDARPVNEIEDSLSGIPHQDEQLIVNAYLQHAIGILKQTVESGYYKTSEDIYEAYPPLKERSEDIEKLFQAA